jgi:adenylate cyclase
LTLGGERREVTFIFTDIAGFTSLMEKSDPAIILPVLNEYLGGMCRIVLEHDGTMDKIVGDAVVGFFGAPADQPDHAARAVHCALALDAFAQSFAETQRTHGIEFGITRIGVNTGMAAVGNFGGASFFNYTAHGDMVNTAARMESVNKHLGTRLCVAGSTVVRCPDVAFRSVGSLLLKGKSEGVDAFEPLAPEAVGTKAASLYREAYALLEVGDPGAEEAFARLLESYPDDKFATFHAERLAAGEKGTTIVLKEK